MANFIDMPLVAEWLRQFDPDDRPAATRLVEAIMLVNLDYFFSGLRTRLLEQAGTARCPIGLYVESNGSLSRFRRSLHTAYSQDWVTTR
jgi:hypothetical protein